MLIIKSKLFLIALSLMLLLGVACQATDNKSEANQTANLSDKSSSKVASLNETSKNTSDIMESSSTMKTSEPEVDFEIKGYKAEYMEFKYQNSRRPGLYFANLKEIKEFFDRNEGYSYIDKDEDIIVGQCIMGMKQADGSELDLKLGYKVDLKTDKLIDKEYNIYSAETESALTGELPEISDERLVEIAKWFEDIILTQEKNYLIEHPNSK